MTLSTCKVIFHLDLNEEKRLNIALANTFNLFKDVSSEQCEVIILFNGPAINLLKKEDLAAHEEDIKTLKNLQVTFKVCNNALNKFNLSPAELMEEFEIVPGGIPELINRQNQGFAYIKP